MHDNVTLARLNREAAEARAISNSHRPAASTAGATNYPVGEVKQHLANAQKNIAEILGRAKG